MERKCQDIINLPAASSNKGKQIYEIILTELVSKLDPGKPALFRGKRESSIVMFIGLRGVGKTKTCAKYARYHRKKGFRPALVCADTFSTNAFLRLNKAAKDEVPVYGSWFIFCSYTADPAELAAEGIAKFKNDKRDLIIVDTSDRHQQYSTLFEEMRLLSQSMNPDLVIYVMDSSIGQAAFDQAQAFKQSFTLGVIIVTNIHGNSQACGAISAVAAAKCPMILTETGDKSEEFEAFEAEPFVRRLLENPWDKPLEYTLRIMYNHYRRESGLDRQLFFHTRHYSKLDLEKFRRYTIIMDSMTDEELDKPNKVKQMSLERLMEIAEASKVDARQVLQMLKTYKMKTKSFMDLEMKIRNESARPRYAVLTS
ncbi:PREDICTED: signal recognition particle 54 kDa protein 3-like isoform X1 [Camelina sativa]|uniref:Signal recognition particle 54 kDa protein 3-like isoform X1 n=1 Tax=Camelina sativa TaxID=90675 RepID=A0ABM0YTM7_CAMSA|nr:PREDICTED: signal recognition particle 54 kDa protein 3-like isoform X1 [Camelina sativa]